MKKRKNKGFKKLIKKMLKGLLKNTILCLIGFGYIFYTLIKIINKQVEKGFKKLPRLLKITLIYLLILGNTPHFIKAYDFVKDYILPQVKVMNIEIENNLGVGEYEKIKKHQDKQRLENAKRLMKKSSNIEYQIFTASLNEGLTLEQSILLVAISKHETGNWTSSNFITKNNFGGLYNGSKGTFYSYETREQGLQVYIAKLKNNYLHNGRDTIEKIGAIYCPVGAANDPKGLNKNWIPRVTQYYNNYLSQV